MSLEGAGVVATTNPGGAKSWRLEYAEALRGAHVVVLRDKDDAGAARVEVVSASLRGIAATARVMEAAVGRDVTDHLLAGKTVDQLLAVPDPEAAGELLIVRMSEVETRTPEYLWDPWLPRATFVELGGDPAAGKTFLACAFAASATHGTWPTGGRTQPTPVVFIAAEDNLEMVLKPRLAAAEARCELITSIKGARGPKGGLDGVLLEQHYQQIAQHIKAEGTGLVYIGCLVDILADHDGHGYTQTRRATRFLPRLAEETGAVKG